MATKAELEAELADLKAQLAKNSQAAKETARQADSVGEQVEETAQFEIPESLVKDLVKEVETLATDKPLVTLAAAFLVGYIVGRAR